MFIGGKEHFTYAGLNSLDMKIRSVSSTSGLYEEGFSAEREIVETSISGRNPYFHKVEKKPYEFNLTLFFENELNENEIRAINKWLNPEYYQPFYFNDAPNKIYKCMPVGRIELSHNGMSQGYLTLTMRCDGAYAYSQEVNTDWYEIVNSGELTIYVDSDEVIAPKIYIEKTNEAGLVSILNQTNNIELKFLEGTYAKGQLYFYGTPLDGEKIQIGNDIYEFDTNNDVYEGNHAVDISEGATRAFNTLLINNKTVIDGDVVRIGNDIYEFDDNDSIYLYRVRVGIGENITETIANLVNAINNSNTSSVEASIDLDGNVLVQYLIPGSIGNNTLVSAEFDDETIVWEEPGYLLNGEDASLETVLTNVETAINTNTMHDLTATANLTTDVITIEANRVSDTYNKISLLSDSSNARWGSYTMLGGRSELQKDEVVYVDNDNKDIVSSLEDTYRFDCFNRKWLKLNPGNNNLLIEGSCKIKFIYEGKLL